MSPSKFQKLVDEEKQNLTDLCDLWENYLSISDDPSAPAAGASSDGPPSSRTRSSSAAAVLGNPSAPSTEEADVVKVEDEELRGLMRTTTGQGRMLIKQRFVQFENLIKDAEGKTSEKPIGDDDLQGFWDMIDFQVVDMKNKFQVLEEAKANSWKLLPREETIATASRKASQKKSASVSAPKERKAKPAETKKSNIRDFIAQKRKEAQEQKKREAEAAKRAAE